MEMNFESFHREWCHDYFHCLDRPITVKWDCWNDLSCSAKQEQNEWVSEREREAGTERERNRGTDLRFEECGGIVVIEKMWEFSFRVVIFAWRRSGSFVCKISKSCNGTLWKNSFITSCETTSWITFLWKNLITTTATTTRVSERWEDEREGRQGDWLWLERRQQQRVWKRIRLIWKDSFCWCWKETWESNGWWCWCCCWGGWRGIDCMSRRKKKMMFTWNQWLSFDFVCWCIRWFSWCWNSCLPISSSSFVFCGWVVTLSFVVFIVLCTTSIHSWDIIRIQCVMFG